MKFNANHPEILRKYFVGYAHENSENVYGYVHGWHLGGR